MSLDSVPDVHLLLTRAQITISAWVPDVCNNEEDRTICEEVCIISRELQIVCPVFLAMRMAMMIIGVKMTMKMNLWSLVMKK